MWTLIIVVVIVISIYMIILSIGAWLEYNDGLYILHRRSKYNDPEIKELEFSQHVAAIVGFVFSMILLGVLSWVIVSNIHVSKLINGEVVTNYKKDNVIKNTKKEVTSVERVKTQKDNVQFQKDSLEYMKQNHRDEYDICTKRVDITSSDGVFTEQMRTCIKRLR